MKATSVAAAVSALALTLSSGAQAHIVLQEKQAQAGATYRAVLVVGHGCGGEATTSIRVRIPEGFYNVKPMQKAGWKIDTVIGEYDKPYSSHGNELTEGVKEISWSGGSLPDDFFDEFAFRGTFDSDAKEGTRIFFPVIQSCGDTEDAWIDQSGDHDVEFPAPSVTLGPPAEHAH